MPKMKPALVRSVASMHFRNADKDKSGSIDFDEFLGIYAAMLKSV